MARLALTGRRQDVLLYVRRLVKKYREESPDLADQFVELLRENPSIISPVRSVEAPPTPVDSDSRMNLLRVESPVVIDFPIVWSSQVTEALQNLIRERELQEKLLTAGLPPSRTALLTGPPGVGKTLAARFLARELGCPLLLLDLATVMSSYLGRTGNNLRQVLDYAKSVDCVLLIDEFDAVGKRRDDPSDIGELKRLVNVLLQEIDDWPHTGLLLAATNHPDLLDPAIWRRFDSVIEFPFPELSQRQALIQHLMSDQTDEEMRDWIPILAALFEGASYDRISKGIAEAKRRSIVSSTSLRDQLISYLEREIQARSPRQKKEFASQLLQLGFSQRRVSEATGLSRDTIRKEQNTPSKVRKNNNG